MAVLVGIVSTQAVSQIREPCRWPPSRAADLGRPAAWAQWSVTQNCIRTCRRCLTMFRMENSIVTWTGRQLIFILIILIDTFLNCVNTFLHLFNVLSNRNINKHLYHVWCVTRQGLTWRGGRWCGWRGGAASSPGTGSRTWGC